MGIKIWTRSNELGLGAGCLDALTSTLGGFLQPLMTDTICAVPSTRDLRGVERQGFGARDFGVRINSSGFGETREGGFTMCKERASNAQNLRISSFLPPVQAWIPRGSAPVAMFSPARWITASAPSSSSEVMANLPPVRLIGSTVLPGVGRKGWVAFFRVQVSGFRVCVTDYEHVRLNRKQARGLAWFRHVTVEGWHTLGPVAQCLCTMIPQPQPTNPKPWIQPPKERSNPQKTSEEGTKL